ncbi:putative defensin-like protein 88 [Raphanus sativus]|uniref:Defensin-like protein 88 n=1 Tax=Raphanus sativus TaxID=3726 RepID=A0A6J0N5W0_RAPSA|nr:putative defensin-like protein 88 [Raphanus sativus]
MATKKFLSLISLMVLVSIYLPMVSGQARECFLQQPCQNSTTCNEFCRFKGYRRGGFCEHFVGSKDGHCCCYFGFESEKFSKSNDTNVLITN